MRNVIIKITVIREYLEVVYHVSDQLDYSDQFERTIGCGYIECIATDGRYVINGVDGSRYTRRGEPIRASRSVNAHLRSEQANTVEYSQGASWKQL